MDKNYKSLTIEKRVVDEAMCVLKNDFTIRKACEFFGVSKSTFHYDLQHRLVKIDFNLHSKVQQVLDSHFSQKHINGGRALQLKYKQKNK